MSEPCYTVVYICTVTAGGRECLHIMFPTDDKRSPNINHYITSEQDINRSGVGLNTAVSDMSS